MTPAINKKKSIGSLVLTLILLLFAFFAVYFFLDMRQAKNLTADVCSRATVGMPIDDLLSTVSETEYRILKSSESIMLVSKKGMGRYHCAISHDGRKITGAKTKFAD